MHSKALRKQLAGSLPSLQCERLRLSAAAQACHEACTCAGRMASNARPLCFSENCSCCRQAGGTSGRGFNTASAWFWDAAAGIKGSKAGTDHAHSTKQVAVPARMGAEAGGAARSTAAVSARRQSLVALPNQVLHSRRMCNTRGSQRWSMYSCRGASAGLSWVATSWQGACFSAATTSWRQDRWGPNG